MNIVGIQSVCWRGLNERLSHSLFARLILLSKEGDEYSRDSVGSLERRKERPIALAIRSIDPPLVRRGMNIVGIQWADCWRDSMKDYRTRYSLD